MVDGAETDIAGATSGTYMLTAEDYGKNVKVRGSFTDRHNNAEGPLVSDIFPEAGDFVLAAPSGVALDTTLKVGNIPNGYFFGCSDGSHHCYRNLGRAYFQYRGREHRVRALYDNDGYNLDELVLRVEWPDAAPPWDVRPDILSLPADNGMVLELDERQFDIADSERSTGSVRYWTGDSLDWDECDQVRVRICDGRCPREVTAHDAQATEGEDASLDFTVTMYPPSDSAVTVQYATSDVTATVGDDYEETSGTLIFAAGETEKTISVRIFDDSREQMRLMLGGGGVAFGTIYNDEAEADEEALTASFSGMPEAHDGSTEFKFRLKFSEEIKQGTQDDLRKALSLSGADVKQVQRVDERYDLFEFTLEPKGDEDATISLGPSATDCTANNAICTSDDEPLTGTKRQGFPVLLRASG